jgi:hypothetical protein
MHLTSSGLGKLLRSGTIIEFMDIINRPVFFPLKTFRRLDSVPVFREM